MSLREKLEAGTRAARNAKFPTVLGLDGGDVIVRMQSPRKSWHQGVPLTVLEESETDLLAELIKTGTRELS